MPGTLFDAVLAGALMHAAWNAIVRAERDRLLGALRLALAAGAVAAIALPWLPQPTAPSWAFIAASAVLQAVYYLLLAAAYRAGDLSEAYPVMRGCAPALVALASSTVFGEPLSNGQWLSVGAICAGVLSLALDARLRHGSPRRVMGFALTNAAVIAAYTLVDGVGVRHAGAPVAYTLWIFLLTAVLLLPVGALHHGAALLGAGAQGMLRSVTAAALMMGSYGLALWAMAGAAVAMVAALRETSIVFAALIARVILKERITRARYAATALLAAGAVAIRLL